MATLLMAMQAPALVAQEWNPQTSASGWARMDVTGAATFHHPQSRKLITWSKDAGIQGELDVSKLEQAPQMWVLDNYNNAWVVCGGTLVFVEKTGKIGSTHKLPAEVQDLAWDGRGFYLAYATSEPFVEKRDFKSGNVIWALKPKKMDPARHAYRMVPSESGQLLVASGGKFALDQVDAAKGKPVGQSVFTFQDAVPPELKLGPNGRGVLQWWLGHSVLLSAVVASQLSGSTQQGLLLARMDLAASSMEFMATGLSEDHAFIGTQDTQAVFVAPKGGLVFLPLK